MDFLADTNIQLRFVNAADPEHVLVREAVNHLLARGDTLYYTQQNRREFWNVCTRPIERNGLGYTIEEAKDRLKEVDAIFDRLADHPGSGPIWDDLVWEHRVMGTRVHDAQLVATMLAHGLTTILTLNDADFRRYSPSILTVHPSEVTAGTPDSRSGPISSPLT